MKRRTRLTIALALLLSLTSIAGVLIAITNDAAAATGETTVSSVSAGVLAAEEAYAEGVIDIVLGETITVSGKGATVDGTTVRITAAGVYSISGTLGDGRIDVDATGKVYLEFDGMDLTNTSGPALLITDAKKVTITLVDGTTNYLIDGKSDAENDAALFTNDTLVINGGGTLVITGNSNEGISSDDDIIINSGTVWVTAVDDALNAHDDITINGGEVYLVAAGDGLDSNGTVHVNGGSLISFGSTAGGDGGLDAIDAFVITGGTVIAGGNTVAAPDADSTQCSLYVATGSTQAPGTVLTVTRDGEEVLSYTPDQEYQNVLVSSPGLIAGATYEVYVGADTTPVLAVAALTPAGAGMAGGPNAGNAAGASQTAGSTNGAGVPTAGQP